MNWQAVQTMAPYLLGVAALWSLVVWFMAKLEPPVEPAEFGAECQCGHGFGSHRSGKHEVLTSCGGGGQCHCSGFEPVGLAELPDLATGDRFASVPMCRHSTYSVEVEGGPLKCVACGEELAE